MDFSIKELLIPFLINVISQKAIVENIEKGIFAISIISNHKNLINELVKGDYIDRIM